MWVTAFIKINLVSFLSNLELMSITQSAVSFVK